MRRSRPVSEKGEAPHICCVPFNRLLQKSVSVDNFVKGYIVFIDHSKAFDNVSHPELFLTMEEMGFSKHLIKLIEVLYTNQEGLIRWNSNHTVPFKILKRVRQGCILSPHLLSLYTEKIMLDADVDSFATKIGGQKITNINMKNQ